MRPGSPARQEGRTRDLRLVYYVYGRTQDKSYDAKRHEISHLDRTRGETP